MSFNSGAKLDPSQVEDVRGSRVGRRGLAVGGGGLGLVVALVWVLLGGSPSTGGTLGSLVDQTVGGGAGEPGPASTALANECNTGADANAREDCRIVGYVNSIQAYWTDEFAASGERYVRAKTRFFTGQIGTGCGVASSASGPVLLPERRVVYIDLGFFDELQLHVRGPGRRRSPRPTCSPTSTVTTSRTCSASCPARRARQGATEQSVRTELQADCYAGVWASNAAATGSSSR